MQSGATTTTASSTSAPPACIDKAGGANTYASDSKFLSPALSVKRPSSSQTARKAKDRDKKTNQLAERDGDGDKSAKSEKIQLKGLEGREKPSKYKAPLPPVTLQMLSKLLPSGKAGDDKAPEGNWFMATSGRSSAR